MHKRRMTFPVKKYTLIFLEKASVKVIKYLLPSSDKVLLGHISPNAPTPKYSLLSMIFLLGN